MEDISIVQVNTSGWAWGGGCFSGVMLIFLFVWGFGWGFFLNI